MKGGDVSLKIITLTLNPAYDIHLLADSFRPGCDNSSRLLSRDAGGKGVNLTRALAAYGVESICYLLLPEESEREYLHALSPYGISPIHDTVQGFVRENINLHTPEGDTVITTEGTLLTADHLRRVESRILPLIDRDTYLVFSGGIPQGSDKAAIIAFLTEARERGARLILDSRSLSIEEIYSLSPFLIKPNLGEAEALFGEKLHGIREATFAAHSIYEKASGRLENILLTVGADGAVLVNASGIYLARAPKIEALSSVGAGDSTVAGFLAATLAGDADADKLRLAIAFGTAACLEEGTMPPKSEKIRELYPVVKIENL